MSQFGPVMLDVQGLTLTADEVQRLQDPRVGGVILFSRNFEDRRQLRALVAALRACRAQPLLIAVDHEGGRVQRFRSGFSSLPAMAALGRLHASQPQAALQAAEDLGFVLAWELVTCGIDFSFTPVLDLDFGHSAVIGDRAFDRDPARAAALAGALVRGLEMVGSAGIGKHFPGHGFVEADSHHDLPIDGRTFAELQADDLVPFRALAQVVRGMMPAHVLYPACDSLPAGFSPFWLQQVLRGQLGFQGAIFSDDLAMGGALGLGTPAQRAQAALAAGCDMVLLCNDAQAADQLLADLGAPPQTPVSADRLAALQMRTQPERGAMLHLSAVLRLDAHALPGWASA